MCRSWGLSRRKPQFSPYSTLRIGIREHQPTLIPTIILILVIKYHNIALPYRLGRLNRLYDIRRSLAHSRTL